MCRLTKLWLSRSQKIAQNCHTGGARCAQKRMKVLPEWIIWQTGWKKRLSKVAKFHPKKCLILMPKTFLSEARKASKRQRTVTINPSNDPSVKEPLSSGPKLHLVALFGAKKWPKPAKKNFFLTFSTFFNFFQLTG